MAKRPTQGPRFVRYFGPTLNALRALGNSATPPEVVDRLITDLGLTDEVVTAVTSTGQSRFEKDVHFARFYLAKDGLIDGSERGVWRLTERGRSTYVEQTAALELFHRVHSAFVRPERYERKARTDQEVREDADQLPEEEEVAFAHRSRLASILKGFKPKGFEQFCALLLRKAGFTEVNVTGRSNDGGIDGFGYLRINPMMTLHVL